MSSNPLVLWRKVLSERNFVILWIAMLVSTAGAFVFLLAASLHAYENFDSSFAVGAVFASQWTLVLAAPSLASWLHVRFPIRRGLVALEGTAAGITLLAALTPQDNTTIAMMLILIVFSLRGVLDAVTKSLRMVVLRKTFDGPTLQLAAALFGTSYYLGGVLGGLLGAFVVTRIPLEEIVFLNVATYIFAAIAYQMLREKKVANLASSYAGKANGKRLLGAWKHALNLLMEMPELRGAFLRLTLTAAAFQGFHNVARTVLPIKMFGRVGSDVALLQSAASAAILIGALTVAWLTSARLGLRLGGTKLIAGVAFAMLLPLAVSSWVVFVILYFVFIFLFEVAFTVFQRDMVVACPTEHMAAVGAASQSTLSIALAVTALAAGALIDLAGAEVAAVGIALTATAFSLLISIGHNASQSSPNAERPKQ